MNDHPASIGRFRIDRLLGEGGMGVVYAGFDETLQREVAIKLLRADAARSSALLREARAAARVRHPSVCTIYEVGEHDGVPFLLMELLDGETLAARLARSALGPVEAAAVVVPALDALAALHDQGLVHLDIKPANIFLTSAGVKLLDFGLAKALTAADPTITQSRAGMLTGTPAYMAPEQVRSDTVDARTDVFAAGILLFELVTGERPFRGATFVDVLQAVLTEHPPALSGSAALVAIDRVVHRALAKDPADRFATAAAMASELRRVLDLPRDPLPAQIKRLKRIAVLPFRLLRPDPDIDFLRLGLADALGTSLAGHENIVVRSALALPPSVAEATNVQAAGSELDADYVITGTLLRSAARVRVSAQLVDVGTGHAKWAQQIDGSMDDLFDLQDDIACKLMSSLPFASKQARDSGEIPRSEVAYRLYLQANQLARHPQTWVAARSLYRDSTVADDRFAPSWAGLGRLERVLAKFQVDGADVVTGYAAAEAALQRAIELSPALAQAHYHYAQLEAETGRTEAALSRLLRRLRVRRTEPEIYAGLVLVCRYCGLLDASVAAHESALALDPSIKTSIGLTRMVRGEYEAAIAVAEEGTDDDLRLLALDALGRRDAALEIARRPAMRISERDSMAPMRRALRAYLEHRPDEALAALHVGAGIDPQRDNLFPEFPDGEDNYFTARFYARLGHRTLALLGVRAAVEKGYFCVADFEADSWLDSIRAEPAFHEAVTLARTRHRRALDVFAEEGGAALLGVDAPSK
ncbi:MAG TPA: serine/threonine-protein kinase [Vicinamibacterales bacterium]|nr:serine/threonine-protein kinase [Vicinamibacterales bacterium]